jgi:C4-dicarboxylate transporter DctQ subunit
MIISDDNTEQLRAFEKLFTRIDHVLSAVESYCGVFCFALMGVFILFSIASRLFFHLPIIWIEEASRYLMIIGVYMGLPIVTREKSHLSLTLLPDLLRGKARTVVRFSCDLLIIATFAALAVICLIYTRLTFQFGQKSAAMAIPMWWMYGLITFTFLLNFIRQAMVMWNDYFAKHRLLEIKKEDITVS